MQAFYPYIAGLYPRRPLGEVLPTELFRVHDARDLIDRSLPGQEARYSMAEQQFASLPLGERITAAKNHAGPRRFYQPHLNLGAPFSVSFNLLWCLHYAATKIRNSSDPSLSSTLSISWTSNPTQEQSPRVFFPQLGVHAWTGWTADIWMYLGCEGVALGPLAVKGTMLYSELRDRLPASLAAVLKEQENPAVQYYSYPAFDNTAGWRLASAGIHQELTDWSRWFRRSPLSNRDWSRHEVDLWQLMRLFEGHTPPLGQTYLGAASPPPQLPPPVTIPQNSTLILNTSQCLASIVAPSSPPAPSRPASPTSSTTTEESTLFTMRELELVVMDLRETVEKLQKEVRRLKRSVRRLEESDDSSD